MKQVIQFFGDGGWPARLFRRRYTTRDPSASKLKCLEFTLPSNFTAPAYDSSPNSAFYSFLTFTDQSDACKGSDIVSRLQDVYGRNVSQAAPFFLDLLSNNTGTSAHFIESISIEFWVDSTNSSNVIKPAAGQFVVEALEAHPIVSDYVLAYKNPICGVNAPKLIDNSTQTRELLAVAYYSTGAVVSFMGEPTSVLSDAYGLKNTSIIVKSVSDSKFDLFVTSDVSSPTADNSYPSLFATLLFKATTWVLCQSAISLLRRTDVSLNSTQQIFVYTFANLSDACGSPTDGRARLGRYFSVPISFSFHYLDIADGIFNITVSEDSPERRRDGNTATFVFFDKSFIPTTTTSTIAPTSTVVSTFASSSTVKASSSIQSTTAQTASGSSVIPTTAVAGVTTAATPTGYVVPTGYGAPTGYGGPTGYGAPTGYGGPTAYGAPAANNIYKGASAGKVGIVSALVVALVFAL
ncbi:hypothetical protein BCR33DRAFT_765950 [Rhizoclosmatium globosum]|uniref:Uncharacterized protein n=1 Tax=Rhizoclosmatium globosum TaxID=329046 RepID=A0A1Y2CBH5_9FUNG|nr:hypothetical protein BCR33DRAFT_765950 [Rhizoclosmatium globosum]|eukprot:ORY44286.1 hypothetical protein BCR33DRAFT_765950 [Rhizoclosmatium globosum]